MRARARELKAKTDGETAMRDAIAGMSPPDRALAKRVDELVKAAAPDLTPKTWYGMPAYARRTARSSASSATRGSSRSATRCSASTTAPSSTTGSMWPIAYALTKLTAADEAKISALVKRAVG